MRRQFFEQQRWRALDQGLGGRGSKAVARPENPPDDPLQSSNNLKETNDRIRPGADARDAGHESDFRATKEWCAPASHRAGKSEARVLARYYM